MYTRLKNNLDELKLTKSKELIDYYSELVNTSEKTFLEALDEIMVEEMKFREFRAVKACVSTSGFPFLKTENDFDFDFQPSISKKQIKEFTNLGFIEKKENIIFIGTPGTGKTHLAIAIGIAAATQRYSTYFISFQELINQLKKASYENRLEKRLKFFGKYKVLIIDELGYLNMDDEAANLFFQLVALRYEKHCTIITSNSSFTKWADIFKNPTLTNALLDRLLHHSHVVSIKGPSYRMKNLLVEYDETEKRENKNVGKPT